MQCTNECTNNSPWRVQRLFHVLRLVSTADSRTERLCVLLPASIRPSCIARMYLIQLSLYLPASQRNKHCPRVVAVLKRPAKELVAEESDWRTTLHVQCKWIVLILFYSFELARNRRVNTVGHFARFFCTSTKYLLFHWEYTKSQQEWPSTITGLD